MELFVQARVASVRSCLLACVEQRSIVRDRALEHGAELLVQVLGDVFEKLVTRRRTAAQHT